MDQKIVVIGGGIIGLASAYYLNKSGYNVTIIEKHNFASASSKGNQGWICPALHTPVPEPGLVGTSLKWLMKKDSPLYIKPSAVPSLSGWLSQFMKFCNEKDFKAGEDALHNLSQTTFELYDALISEGLEFEMYHEGMLFLFLTEKGLQQQFNKFNERSNLYGHEKPTILSKEEVRKLEPNVSDEVVGGLLMEYQRHINPESLSKALIKKLKDSNTSLYENTEVTDVELINNKATAVKIGNQRIEADTFLLTAGAWSGKLAEKFDYNLPVQAGKGYSITMSNPNLKFSHPMYLGDTKAGVSPFKDAVRIGGTMELSGINNKIDKSRIQGIKNSVSKYFKDKLNGNPEVEWTGMRPMTPDGLPVIGKIPDLKNTFVATGHGMVGVSMAPVTGQIISDLIDTGWTNYDIVPFNPERFTKSKTR